MGGTEIDAMVAEASPVTASVAPSGALPSGPVKSPATNTASLADGSGQVVGWMLRADDCVARVRPWPGEPGTVQLITLEQTAPPARVIQRWMEELARSGVRLIRTGALGPTIQPSYLECGFSVRQELSLLSHGLAGVRGSVVPSESLLLRRGRRTDLASLAVVDRSAFGPLWAMDVHGVADACQATPHHRLRIALEDSAVIGFAVSGRAGRSAYLQRLAVAPESQGHGVGRALTVDALRWARRQRCTSMMVNTHVENETALALYRSLGFQELAYRLAVLERSLP